MRMFLSNDNFFLKGLFYFHPFILISGSGGINERQLLSPFYYTNFGHGSHMCHMDII